MKRAGAEKLRRSEPMRSKRVSAGRQKLRSGRRESRSHIFIRRPSCCRGAVGRHSEGVGMRGALAGRRKLRRSGWGGRWMAFIKRRRHNEDTAREFVLNRAAAAARRAREGKAERKWQLRPEVSKGRTSMS
jgi:hypothetical protein